MMTSLLTLGIDQIIQVCLCQSTMLTKYNPLAPTLGAPLFVEARQRRQYMKCEDAIQVASSKYSRLHKNYM